LLGWEQDGFPLGVRIFSLKWKISAPVSGWQGLSRKDRKIRRSSLL
jgi:hypothetical protein